ncbi:Flavoprotein [Niveomyces insectorum RCEF 264]|uniref:Flavoprotein n=1 Tax=Niveomyces insectorum RCEF 264 TaxID=1081102 RepID=A0A167VJB5_9HYPO|nr:Flavoprotein [Niveomyces insectorum RCEF 264]
MNSSSLRSDDQPPPAFVHFLPKTPSSASFDFDAMPREPQLNLLVAANGPKEVAYAQAIAVRLSKEPKIAIKVIVDDLTHRLTQEFPAYANRCLRSYVSFSGGFGGGGGVSTGGSSSSNTGGPASYNSVSPDDVEYAQRRAFELVAWADLLVLAPLDADHLARMMAGLADTLLLAVLRSWDASKRILLVPGMSTHMWENPVTKRQISKLHRKWHWIRVLPPILWHYADQHHYYHTVGSSGSYGGYSHYGHTSSSPSPVGSQLQLHQQSTTSLSSSQPQQRKRVVEWTGFADLISIIKNHADLQSLGHDVDVAVLSGNANNSSNPPKRVETRLPPELWTIILEYTGDWELAEALGVFTHLPMPTNQGWRRQPRDPSDPQQVFMHELEWTLLTARTDRICQTLARAPVAAVAAATATTAASDAAANTAVTTNMAAAAKTAPPTPPAPLHDLSALAIKLIFKFALTDVLAYIEAYCPLVFRHFDGKTVPTKASAYFGRTEILDWWLRSPSFLEKQYDAEALDGASKNGYVHVLEWWRRSGLPLRYTEAALEQASARGHVHVLAWWREASLANPGLMLKPGRSLLCAAQHGRVAVLRWWEEESGLNAGHQDAVCRVASRWGQVAVLELWRELRGDDQITFNHQVLVEPTMYSHVDVLAWWRDYAHGRLPHMDGRRAKQVEYRAMDIEEALEDALGDQTAVRRWWAENGLNLGLGTSEWMKPRYL